MEQMSMFDPIIPYPASYEDIDSLFRDYIFEGESDDDIYSFNEIKNGRSYYFYGKKVFSFYPLSKNGPLMKIAEPDNKETPIFQNDLPSAIERLKKTKHQIFRNIIIETFACCNDFKRCSDAGSCLYPKDRFYNGCLYRKNLESGKNFYLED